jgi:tetratricopeptide (TPR) repeat protein
MYSQAVEHLKTCVDMDPKHPYAYNNLAFLYNMHQIYKDTIATCKQAKEFDRHGHGTHRHWAFAEFKEGNLVKAIKKIRKGVQKQP